MIAALTENERIALIGFAGVVLTGILGFLGIYVQNRRLSNTQRDDHAATAKKVDELVVGQAEIKADLRDVKDEVRSHGDRLRHLEHWQVVKDDNTNAIDALDRLQSEVRELRTNHKEAS